MNIIEISRRDLESLGVKPSSDTRVYFHPLRIVGTVFWKRFGKMIELAEPSKNQTALDFGCGHGLFLPTLSRNYGNVIGLDVRALPATENILKKFNCKNTKVYKMDGNNLSFTDETFDAVFCADVLEHFKDMDRPLGEIRRVLRPGGKIVINTPLENPFFKVARAMIGYKKPADHYHSAKEVAEKVGEYFSIRKIWRYPTPFRTASVLEILVAHKEEGG